MGLLRRPTPGEIVEGGRSAGPAGRVRYRAHSKNSTAGFAAILVFQHGGYHRNRRVEQQSPCPTAGGDVQVQFEACSPPRRATVDASIRPAVAGRLRPGRTLTCAPARPLLGGRRRGRLAIPLSLSQIAGASWGQRLGGGG